MAAKRRIRHHHRWKFIYHRFPTHFPQVLQMQKLDKSCKMHRKPPSLLLLLMFADVKQWQYDKVKKKKNLPYIFCVDWLHYSLWLNNFGPFFFAQSHFVIVCSWRWTKFQTCGKWKVTTSLRKIRWDSLTQFPAHTQNQHWERATFSQLTLYNPSRKFYATSKNRCNWDKQPCVSVCFQHVN